MIDREIKIAQELTDWYKKNYAFQLAENGTYKGWVMDFGYSIEGKPFALDLHQKGDRWGLLILAITWSYSSQYENASAFIGILKELGMLEHESWQELGAEHILKAARERLHARLGSSTGFPFPWNQAHRAHKTVEFRKDWSHGLKNAVERWPEIQQIFQDVIEGTVSGENFIRAFREKRDFSGLSAISARPLRRLKVKIPLLLRELRCQGFSEVKPEYCSIPDTRVMEMRKILRLPCRNINDTAGLLWQIERISREYGELYDLPLFAFREYCRADQKGKKPDHCPDCPVERYCLS